MLLLCLKIGSGMGGVSCVLRGTRTGIVCVAGADDRRLRTGFTIRAMNCIRHGFTVRCCWRRVIADGPERSNRVVDTAYSSSRHNAGHDTRQQQNNQKDHNINVPQLALPSWMSKEK